MRWVSIAELQAQMDPHHRAVAQNRHFQQCMAQAKFEQDERHHCERQQLESDRLDANLRVAEIQGRTMLERERIAGDNAMSLATRNHALAQSAKSSALIDEMVLSTIRQDEEWNRTFADTMRGLILNEADTIKQERLRKMDQDHLIEKLRLESNLRMVELVLAHELQNARVAYDKACDIIFRLVERALGLGPHQAEADQVRDWVREAMDQTAG